MADDGFLLNIASVDSNTMALAARRHQKQEYRMSKTWKGRRVQAKEYKKTKGTADDSTDRTHQTFATADTASRAVPPKTAEGNSIHKKQRLTDENDTHQVASNVATAPLSLRAGKQIISSLFTKNPEIPTLPRAPEDHEQKIASNAVLDTSSFTGIGLDSDIAKCLETKMDVTNPTAIQQNAIPALIGKVLPASSKRSERYTNSDAFDVDAEVQAEHDVFIQAATGSGKTLAYLLPIFHRLVEAGSVATPNSAPSRDMGTF
ncbi:ATP-dependent RNA helicase dbp7, partial [Coemansia sp. BCRC 34490]